MGVGGHLTPLAYAITIIFYFINRVKSIDLPGLEAGYALAQGHLRISTKC